MSDRTERVRVVVTILKREVPCRCDASYRERGLIQPEGCDGHHHDELAALIVDALVGSSLL